MDKQAIIERLKKDEGFAAKAYWDREQWTYGYGCKAPSKGSMISEPDAAQLLSRRVDQSIAEFWSMFHDLEINEVRQQALVNMLFNLGKGGVQKFKKMLAAIRADNWTKVAEEARDSLWYQQVGKRAKRICYELENGVPYEG